MHVEYLQYLIEVSNCRSISAAAKKLFLSQTTLSAIIASLEKDLNITFFNRTHKGITLTQEGKQALEIIQEILAKNEELRTLSASNAAIHSIVNVAAYPSVANMLSVYLACQFAENHPGFSLKIHELPYSQTFNAISEGLTNIAVAAENSNLINIRQEMIKHGLEIEPLYKDKFYAIVSSKFRLAGRDSIDLSELLDERLAFTHAFPSFNDRYIAPVIRMFSTYIICNNIESVKASVAENSAVAIVPGVAILDDYRINRDKIRKIEVTGFDTELTNYLLYKKYSMLSVTERAVIGEIKAFYRSLPENADLMNSEDNVSDDINSNSRN